MIALTAGLSACSSPGAPSSQSPTTSTQARLGSVDCSKVQRDLSSIRSAQNKMVDDGTTTPQQIAGFVKQIDVARASFAEQARHALPTASTTWLSQTDAYLQQMIGGAASGKSVFRMLMAVGSFSSQPYQRAAKAVSAYFTTQCLGISIKG